jgi:HD-like signal output (HDOD) protein
VKTPLELLMEEMDRGGDFPALSSTIGEINRAIGDDSSRNDAMTGIILRDIALTKKLLRLVNAAHLGTFNGEPISTISRAVVLLGFDAIRDAAISLLLFEHLNQHAHVDELKGEAVDSFFRGILGRLLAASAGVRDSEEAFIGALFRELGRLMARFHFYEKTQRIQRLMTDEGLGEDAAARRVLGVDFDQLGVAIAKHWHFPSPILQAMSPLPDAQVGAATSDAARLRVVANLARDLHRAVAGKPPEEPEQAIEALARRYRGAARIDKESLVETVRRAVEVLRSDAVIMNVDISKSVMAPLMSPGKSGAEDGATEDSGADDPTSVLAQGIQDMTAMLLGEFQLADIFKTLAEVFYRTRLFDHVLVCVLDRASQSLVGRVALGRSAASMRDAFRIPLTATPDVFHAAIAQAQDILISDATADNIRDRIPAWYARVARAHAFLLLPIVADGKPLALLYADKLDQPLHLPPQVLGLLKALRSQATLALRQH